jgi:hypothetical protein
MSGNFESSRPWYRLRRMVERSDATRRVVRPVELREFYRQVDGHLSGSWLKTEVQACGVRLYVLYREVEEQLGRDGSLESFALVLGEGTPRVFNWLRGAQGVKRYSSDLLHAWSTLLTKHWSKEQVVVSILCHPTGLIEPIVSGVPTSSEGMDSE